MHIQCVPGLCTATQPGVWLLVTMASLVPQACMLVTYKHNIATPIITTNVVSKHVTYTFTSVTYTFTLVRVFLDRQDLFHRKKDPKIEQTLDRANVNSI